MTAPHPLDSAVAAEYLVELRSGITVAEAEAVLEAPASADLTLAQEQFLLSAVIAEMADPGHPPQAERAAGRLRGTAGATDLYPAARDCVNRLLNDPWAEVWKGHPDGAISVKRQARALRARLHRACSD